MAYDKLHLPQSAILELTGRACLILIVPSFCKDAMSKHKANSYFAYIKRLVGGLYSAVTASDVVLDVVTFI